MNPLHKKPKRKRGTNWTWEMKLELVELVKPYSHIINTKLNTTDAINEKNICWKQIRNQMEASGYPFTVKQLRDQWSRTKATSFTSGIHSSSLSNVGGGDDNSGAATTKIHKHEELSDCGDQNDSIYNNSDADDLHSDDAERLVNFCI